MAESTDVPAEITVPVGEQIEVDWSDTGSDSAYGDDA